MRHHRNPDLDPVAHGLIMDRNACAEPDRVKAELNSAPPGGFVYVCLREGYQLADLFPH